MEKNLNGFKETVNQVSELQIKFAEALKELSALKINHRGIRKRIYSVPCWTTILFCHFRTNMSHPEQVKALREETLFVDTWPMEDMTM